KLDMAHKFGATHTINSKTTADLGAALRDIVGAKGADKVIETTGVKALIETGYDVTQPKGTCVLVGVPIEKVTIYSLPLHFKKILTGSEGGDCVPDIDIPRIIKLDRAGRLSFEGLITHEYPLDQINQALDQVRSGSAGRVLLNMWD
ncbi:MAG: zinc-binding dehydrogenase, partial [Pseudolabrys sp.]|nr:zinc-binding dehydrogenase [Pseudolabrys sp.]